MKILSQERFDEAQNYARKLGDNSFDECVERLKKWERSEYNIKKKCEIVLYQDFAPYSMMFEERYEDGTCGICGGLIYHGSPDVSCSVQLTPKQGWQIHT